MSVSTNPECVGSCDSFEIDALLAHLVARQPQELPQLLPIALHLHFVVLHDEVLLQEQQISDAVSPDVPPSLSLEFSLSSSELLMFSVLERLLLDFLFLPLNFPDSTHSSSVASTSS